MSDLPEGWAEAELGRLLELKYGKSLPATARRDGAVNVYGSNGVVGSHDVSVTSGTAIIIGRKGSVGYLGGHPKAAINRHLKTGN